jgi:hypothetical protein
LENFRPHSYYLVQVGDWIIAPESSLAAANLSVQTTSIFGLGLQISSHNHDLCL